MFISSTKIKLFTHFYNRMHHDYYEITFSCRGGGILHLGNEEPAIKEGDEVFLSYGIKTTLIPFLLSAI